MAYTRSIGRSIYAAELYNEPNAPEYPELPKGYTTEQFGRDFATFSAFMAKAAPSVKLAGPGNATLGIPGVASIMKPSPEDYAMADPKPRFGIFSYHFYPVLSQRCAPANSPQSITMDKALDPDFLARPERQGHGEEGGHESGDQDIAVKAERGVLGEGGREYRQERRYAGEGVERDRVEGRAVAF